MLLYEVFIAPIELGIKLIFEVSYRYTNDYLVSTILLSLAVSTLILPLYYWAESLQKKEQRKFRNLKPILDEFKRTYKGSELHAVTKILYRQNNYHPIYSLRSLVGLAIQVPFFIAAYHFLSNYEAVRGVETLLFADLGAPDFWLKMGSFKVSLMPILMTAVNISTGVLYLHNNEKKELLQLWLLAFLFLVLLYDSPSILLFYWTLNNIFYFLKNIIERKILNNKQDKGYTEKVVATDQSRIIRICVFISTFLLFVFPTTQIIASAPGEFSSPGLLVGIMFYLFLLAYLVLIIIGEEIGKYAGLNVYTHVVLVVCLYFLLNYFVLEGSYGLMDFFIFHRPDMMESSYLKGLIDLAIPFILMLLVIALFKLFSFNFFFMGLRFVLLMLVSTSILSLTRIYIEMKGAGHVIAPYQKNVQIDEIEPKYHFSKNGKNVLVIFFDRFMSGFVPDILEDIPSLKKDLAGFTWYPNTLSLGTGTPVGLAPIYGGYKYCDVEVMQESGYDWPKGYAHIDDSEMQQRFVESTSFLVKKFIDAGFRSFVSDPNFIQPEVLNDIDKNSYSELLIGKYTNLFYPDSVVALNENTRSPGLLIKNYLLPYSLFKVFPPSLREELYNNGRWWNTKELGIETGWIKNYIDNLSLARAWPLISVVDEEIDGSYMFTTNNLTHDTYAALNNGRFQTVVPNGKMKEEAREEHEKLFSSDDIPEEDLKRFKDGFSAVHFYSSKEALVRTAEWIKWMRENDVYDNTKIIIVSDHGYSGVHDPMFSEQKNANGIWYGAYHPILMVKDYSERKDLTIDNSLMTNADVPSFVLSSIKGEANEGYDYIKTNGFRVYTEEGNLTITNNIFDLNNWIYRH